MTEEEKQTGWKVECIVSVNMFNKVNEPGVIFHSKIRTEPSEFFFCSILTSAPGLILHSLLQTHGFGGCMHPI